MEVALALRIELRYDKREHPGPLRLQCAVRWECGGIGGGSVALLRAPCRELSWSESATLAVLPNAPSAIYPGRAQDALRAKRDRLLAAPVDRRDRQRGMVARTAGTAAGTRPSPAP